MVKYIFPILLILTGCSNISKPTDEDFNIFNGLLYQSDLKETLIDVDSSFYEKTSSKIYLTDSLVFIVIDSTFKQKLFVDEIIKDEKNLSYTYWLSFYPEHKTVDAMLYVESKTDSTYIQYIFGSKAILFNNCYKLN